MGTGRKQLKLVARLTPAMVILVIVVSGFGGCGSEAKRATVDPAAEVAKAISRVRAIKSGRISGRLKILEVGSSTNESLISVDGPFDISDPTRPSFDITMSTAPQGQDRRSLRVVAVAGRYYLDFGDRIYAAPKVRRKRVRSRANPDGLPTAKELADTVRAVQQAFTNHRAGPPDTIDGVAVSSYVADVNIPLIAVVGTLLFNSFAPNELVPDIPPDDGQQLIDILRSSIKSSTATVQIGDRDGLIRGLQVAVLMQITNETQRVDVHLDGKATLTDLNQPVTVKVPRGVSKAHDPKLLDARLGQRIGEMTGGLGGFGPNASGLLRR